MKNNFQHIGLAKLCGWFGITRQAYYQNSWGGILTTFKEAAVLQQVRFIRNNHPRIGTRKLYEMLQPFMLEHSIKMGRDALFSILSANFLLVKNRKRRIQTTNSYHWLRKYPNLVKEFIPTAINQLWVSDITYWRLKQSHVYISLITDAYSHKIVGFHVAETLEATETIQALKKALCNLNEENAQLIHHSDRGLQYCSHAYVKLLQDYNIRVSMTENGDPLENAIAERVNGIIKGEYLDTYNVSTIEEAKNSLQAAIDLYNNERPHLSIGNLTPTQIHQAKKPIKTEKLWKNYYRKQPTFVNQFQD